MAKTRAQGIAFTRQLLNTVSTEAAGDWDDTEISAFLDEGQTAILSTVDERLLAIDSNSQSFATVTSLVQVGGAGSPKFWTRNGSNLRTVGVAVGNAWRPATRADTWQEFLERNYNTYSSGGAGSYFYFEREGRFYINSDATATGVAPIRESYIRKPPALTAAQGFIVSDVLFPWVCMYAACTALIQKGNFNSANAFHNLVRERMADFRVTWKLNPPELPALVPAQA